MKNRLGKRIIAVLLCLAVFAGSELTGLTNIVGDMFAAENQEFEAPEADVQTTEIEVQPEEPAEEPGIPETPAEEPILEEPALEPETPQPPVGPDAEPAPEEAPAPEMPADTPGADASADIQNPETLAGADEEVTNAPEDLEVVTDPDEADTPSDMNDPADITETEQPEEIEETLPEENLEDSEKEETEEVWPEYKKDCLSDDGKVTVYVAADEGVFPENTELVVKAIVPQDVEALEADAEVSGEEVQEAKAIQEKFDAVQKELEETTAGDETKEIAGFLAYDISFWTEVEDEETGEISRVEIEPKEGMGVSVEMEFAAAVLPEEMNEATQIDSVDVIHMKETEEGLKAEKIENATVNTTQGEKVETAAFDVGEFSVFTIAWVRNTWKITKDIHIVEASSESFKGFDVDDISELGEGTPALTVSSANTPPTLYIDTISESGVNQSLYKVQSKGVEYHFEQAFLTVRDENQNYQLVDDKPIVALQVLFSDDGTNTSLRYMLQDTGEYHEINEGQEIAFAYGKGNAPTSAKYYSNEGISLVEHSFEECNESDYNLQQIGNSLSGICVINSSELEGKGVKTHLEKLNGKDGKVLYSYDYSHMEIVKGGQTILPVSLRYNEDGVLQYSIFGTEVEADYRRWLDVGTAEIRLIYRQNQTIETVNTAGVVDIDLFDYMESNTPPDFYFEKSKFQFFNGNSDGEIWNVSDKGIKQGIVEPDLYVSEDDKAGPEDNYIGYPKLSQEIGSNFLKPLFDESNYTAGHEYGIDKYPYYQTGHKVYTGLNYLFVQDEEGYYSYDSDENYAYFNWRNKGNKNFTVYSKDALTFTDKSGNTSSSKCQFFPFTSIDNYATSYSNPDYHFGMRIGFNFTQPENGKIGEKPMVFEFSGDDDVWVFIDGKLVLDIGGIHGKQTGQIDFASGIVTRSEVVNLGGSSVSSNTSLKEIFGWETEDTFEDNTVHRLEFFYFERGAGQSNCAIRFNLQPQKAQTIEVAKEITNAENAKYSNVEFAFKLFLENGKGQNAYDVTPEGTTFVIKKDGIEDRTGTIETDGIFRLKHGESAVFDNINAGLRYYVQEVGISGGEFSDVQVDGTTVSKYKDGTEELLHGVTSGTMYMAQTSPILVGEAGKVVFKNECSEANRNELFIKKEVQGGITDNIKDDQYSFKIYLEAQSNQNKEEGLLTEYKNGPYYLQNNQGYYCKVNAKGTPEVTDIKNIQQAEVYGRSSTEGTISDIPAGYSIVIPGILTGTNFYVEEIGLEEFKETDGTMKYEPYVKRIEEGTCEEGTAHVGSLQDIRKADGSMKLNTDAKVVIVNVPAGVSAELYDWEIVKRSSSDQSLLLENAEFELYSKDNSNSGYYGISGTDGTVKWYADKVHALDGKDEISDFARQLSPGEYILREVKAPGGYLKVNGSWEIVISANNKPEITSVNDEAKNALMVKESDIKSVFYISNEALYELPSTGGVGIFWYMISGTLLMIAGVLVLYKRKFAGRC